MSNLYKSIAGRYRPVRVADGPIKARFRFIKNASWCGWRGGGGGVGVLGGWMGGCDVCVGGSVGGC